MLKMLLCKRDICAPYKSLCFVMVQNAFNEVWLVAMILLYAKQNNRARTNYWFFSEQRRSSLTLSCSYECWKKTKRTAKLPCIVWKGSILWLEDALNKTGYSKITRKKTFRFCFAIVRDCQTSAGVSNQRVLLRKGCQVCTGYYFTHVLRINKVLLWSRS